MTLNKTLYIIDNNNSNASNNKLMIPFRDNCAFLQRVIRTYYQTCLSWWFNSINMWVWELILKRISWVWVLTHFAVHELSFDLTHSLSEFTQHWRRLGVKFFKTILFYFNMESIVVAAKTISFQTWCSSSVYRMESNKTGWLQFYDSCIETSARYFLDILSTLFNSQLAKLWWL